MDKSMIEKKIVVVTEQISKDEAEVERTVAAIKRSQDRKRILEVRIRENRQILSDLKNRRAVQTIEGSIGRMDDAKLALLVKLLEEHGDEIGKEDDEGPETGDKTERERV